MSVASIKAGLSLRVWQVVYGGGDLLFYRMPYHPLTLRVNDGAFTDKATAPPLTGWSALAEDYGLMAVLCRRILEPCLYP